MGDPLNLELGPGPAAVAEGLGAIGDLLEGLSAEARASVRLIVSELVESAAKLDRSRPVSLSLSRNNGTVLGRIAVDTTRWEPPVALDRGRQAELGTAFLIPAGYRWGAVRGRGIWFELTDPRDPAVDERNPHAATTSRSAGP